MRKTPIIAMLILGIMIFAGFVALAQITPPEFAGKSYTQHGVTGNSVAKGAPNDLLDATQYITSWKSDRESEKIVIRGFASLSGSWTGSPLYYDFKLVWYKVSLRSNGAYPDVKINGIPGENYVTNATTPGDAIVQGGKWISIPGVIVTVNGPYSGVVHVEMWGHIHWITIPPLSKGGDFMLASDEASLKSGVGHLTAPLDSVEEGQNAVFHVETGFSHSVASPSAPSGWTFSIYNPSQDPSSTNSVYSTTIADDYNGNINWLVPNGSYRLTWSNQYWAVLKNDFLDQDQKSMWVIGVGMTKQIPGKPSLELTKGKSPFSPGDNITIRVSATSNPIGYPVTGFYVSLAASEGDIVNYYIFQSKFYEATSGQNNLSYADISFVVPDTGDFRMEAASFDTHHLSSGNSIYYLHAYEGGGNKDIVPTDLVMLILVIMLAVLAVVGGILLIFYAPIPYPFNILVGIAVVGLAVGLAIWWISGNTDLFKSSAQILARR